MALSSDGSQHLEVWMDGSCELCSRSQAWCESRDHGDRLVFRNFRDTDEATLPVDREAHEESMWVRTDAGALYEGFAAWRLIMKEIPGWRWLAEITGLPPFSWFGPAVYRMVARFRRHMV